MLPGDESFLQCPGCGGDLVLSVHSLGKKGAVKEGELRCLHCSLRYVVVEYVVVLMSKDEALSTFSAPLYGMVEAFYESTERDAAFSVNEKHVSGVNWGYQFADAFPVSSDSLERDDGFWGEQAFYRFCGLGKDDLKGKNVCTFCGGSGREAWHLCRSEADKVVVVDIGDHLFNLPRLLEEHLDRLVLVRADVFRCGLRSRCLDVGVCDHALQHIPDQSRAYAFMTDKVKVGGKMSICVYSHENNFIMTGLVEPLKCLFHRIPLKVLRLLSVPPAVLLFALFHVLYVPYASVGATAKGRLPYYELFRLWNRDGFGKFWEACFDLMQAPVSYHFRKDEVEELASIVNAEMVHLELVNETMWTMVARIR